MKDIGAAFFIETSSKTGEQIDIVKMLLRIVFLESCQHSIQKVSNEH